jgi:hypothetical protein
MVKRIAKSARGLRLTVLLATLFSSAALAQTAEAPQVSTADLKVMADTVWVLVTASFG